MGQYRLYAGCRSDTMIVALTIKRGAGIHDSRQQLH
jgi:hypothetical protein